MLCGAPSWLSKTISNAASAGALTSVGLNLRSFAVTTMAFGSTEPAGAAGLAEDPEHAARTAARAPAEDERQSLHVDGCSLWTLKVV
jgi:hypothetical protein